MGKGANKKDAFYTPIAGQTRCPVVGHDPASRELGTREARRKAEREARRAQRR